MRPAVGRSGHGVLSRPSGTRKRSRAVHPSLERLGCSRIAPPGQEPGPSKSVQPASWYGPEATRDSGRTICRPSGWGSVRMAAGLPCVGVVAAGGSGPQDQANSPADLARVALTPLAAPGPTRGGRSVTLVVLIAGWPAGVCGPGRLCSSEQRSSAIQENHDWPSPTRGGSVVRAGSDADGGAKPQDAFFKLTVQAEAHVKEQTGEDGTRHGADDDVRQVVHSGQDAGQ